MLSVTFGRTWLGGGEGVKANSTILENQVIVCRIMLYMLYMLYMWNGVVTRPYFNLPFSTPNMVSSQGTAAARAAAAAGSRSVVCDFHSGSSTPARGADYRAL